MLSPKIHLGSPSPHLAISHNLSVNHWTEQLKGPLQTEQECVQTKFWETSGKIVVSDCNSVEVGCAAAGLYRYGKVQLSNSQAPALPSVTDGQTYIA